MERMDCQMDNNKLTEDQLQALVQFASKKLGTTPEKLAKTVQQGDLSSIASKLQPSEAAKLNAITSDKNKAEQLVGSPEAQKLIQQLLNQNKNQKKK